MSFHFLQVAGYAVGGGHVLHMVCDLTVAADNAIFGQTGPKVLFIYVEVNTLHITDYNLKVYVAAGRKLRRWLWKFNHVPFGKALKLMLLICKYILGYYLSYLLML